MILVLRGADLIVPRLPIYLCDRVLQYYVFIIPAKSVKDCNLKKWQTGRFVNIL